MYIIEAYKKWKTKFNNENRNNYEVSNFKKQTIRDLIEKERQNLKVNDIIFLKNKENESLILLEVQDNYLNKRDSIENGSINRVFTYNFMYSKDRKIYPFLFNK